MNVEDFMKKYLNDTKLLNDLQKQIIKNNSNLEIFTKLNFKLDIIDSSDIKNEDLFKQFFKAKIKAQHLLNVFSNKDYFKDTSKDLIFKNVAYINGGLSNGQHLLEEVTKSILEYIVLVYILKERKDISSEDCDIPRSAVNKRQTNTDFKYVAVKKDSVRRSSICFYCDTPISESDVRCPICEAEVKREEIAAERFGNGIKDNSKRKTSENNHMEDDHPELSLKVAEVDDHTMEKTWLCFYCNYPNEERVSTCTTCLTSKIESIVCNDKPKDLKDINDSNTRDDDKERISDSLTNDKVPTLDKVLKETSKVTILAEVNKCDWICSYCGYNNVDLDEYCLTCLTCLNEGKSKVKDVDTDSIKDIKKENDKVENERKDFYQQNYDDFDDCNAVKMNDKDNLAVKHKKDTNSLNNLDNVNKQRAGRRHISNSLDVSNKRNKDDKERKSYSLTNDKVPSYEPNISDKVSIIAKNETNKVLKETSKVTILAEVNKCDWICTLCGYNNVGIDVSCLTCLTCLKEGKPKVRYCNSEIIKEDRKVILGDLQRLYGKNNENKTNPPQIERENDFKNISATKIKNGNITEEVRGLINKSENDKSHLYHQPPRQQRNNLKEETIPPSEGWTLDCKSDKTNHNQRERRKDLKAGTLIEITNNNNHEKQHRLVEKVESDNEGSYVDSLPQRSEGINSNKKNILSSTTNCNKRNIQKYDKTNPPQTERRNDLKDDNRKEGYPKVRDNNLMEERKLISDDPQTLKINENETNPPQRDRGNDLKNISSTRIKSGDNTKKEQDLINKGENKKSHLYQQPPRQQRNNLKEETILPSEGRTLDCKSDKTNHHQREGEEDFNDKTKKKNTTHSSPGKTPKLNKCPPDMPCSSSYVQRDVKNVETNKSKGKWSWISCFSKNKDNLPSLCSECSKEISNNKNRDMCKECTKKHKQSLKERKK